MPRTAGTYAIPAGTLRPAVAGSPASAADFNAFIADLEDAITDSLSRTGNGGMAAPMEFTKGSDAAPGITFTGDTDTGVNSDTANVIDLVAGGVAALNVTATGVTVPGTLGVTGAQTIGGDLTVTGTITSAGGVINTAKAVITIAGAGVANITGGRGIASASWSTYFLTVNFTSDFPDALYFASAVQRGIGGGGANFYTVYVHSASVDLCTWARWTLPDSTTCGRPGTRSRCSSRSDL